MLVAVCSVKGSPGVTTFSLALAARWPAGARCVLVECDPSGGDLATRFSLVGSSGLVSLAAAGRRRIQPDLVWQHTQALPGGLPVVCAPPGAEQARAALSALASETPSSGVLIEASRLPGAVLIADCGRIDPESVTVPVVRAADAMLVVSRAHADDLAHLVSRLDGLGRWSSRPVLLLTGSGYSTAEVERELGVLPMARIPNDPRGAAVLSGRPGGRGGPTRSPLGRMAARIAAALAPPPAPALTTVPVAPLARLQAATSPTLVAPGDRSSRNGLSR